MNLNEINNKILTCKKCLQGPIELGWGTPQKILFIGQCPSFLNITGARGTSNFDKFFLRLLSKINITESDFYFTNLIKVPANVYRLEVKVVRHYKDHLLEEIQEIKPKVIIVLGKFADEWLRDDLKYEKMMHPGALHYQKKEAEEKWISNLKQILQKYEIL